MEQYLIWFGCGLLGLIFANIRKIISIRRKGNLIDYNFKLSSYFNMDWDVIFSQVVVIVCGLMVFKLFSDKSWYKFGELIFILIGGIGSELLNTFMSKAEKDVINKIKNYGNAPDMQAKPEVIINEVAVLPLVGNDGEWYHISGNEYFYYNGTRWMSIVGGRPNDRP